MNISPNAIFSLILLEQWFSGNAENGELGVATLIISYILLSLTKIIFKNTFRPENTRSVLFYHANNYLEIIQRSPTRTYSIRLFK